MDDYVLAKAELVRTASSLADFKGKTVVLEWFNPDCPFIKHAHTQGPLKDMAKRVMGGDLVWLSINSGAPGKQGHGKTVVDDHDSARGNVHAAWAECAGSVAPNRCRLAD